MELQKSFRDKIKVSVEAQLAEIEARIEKEASQQADIDWSMDQGFYQTAYNKWKNSDRTEPEPQRESFDGAWQRSLIAARTRLNAELIAFEKERKANAKKLLVW
jgi:hypothetical protein